MREGAVISLSEERLSVPGSDSAFSRACPGVLTQAQRVQPPEQLQRHADACAPQAEQPDAAGTRTSDQHPARNLSPPSASIHGRVKSLGQEEKPSNSAPPPPPFPPLLSTFDTSVFKPHLSLGNRGPLSSRVFIPSTSLVCLPCSSSRVSLVRGLVHLNVARAKSTQQGYRLQCKQIIIYPEKVTFCSEPL